MANFVDAQRQQAMLAAWRQGFSIRKISRTVAVNKNTVITYARRYREQFGGKPRCECGRESGHRDWCSVRFAESPARQAWMKNVIRRIGKPSFRSMVGTVWKAEFPVFSLRRCGEKGCVLPAQTGSQFCLGHSGILDESLLLFDRALAPSDFIKFADSMNTPMLRLMSRWEAAKSMMPVADAGKNIQHTGAQVIRKGFGKKKIRKLQRQRHGAGPRPKHDVFKRWDRETIDKIPQWAPVAKIESAEIIPMPDVDYEEIEREELIQELIEQQKEDAADWVRHSGR